MRIYDRFTCPDAPLSPPEEPEENFCPRCGARADIYYCDADGRLVGCEECLQPTPANQLY